MRGKNRPQLLRRQSQTVVGFGAQVGVPLGLFGTMRVSPGEGHDQILFLCIPSTLIIPSIPENPAELSSLFSYSALGLCSLITHLCDSSSATTLLLTFSLVLCSILHVLPEESSEGLVWPRHSPARHPPVAPVTPRGEPAPCVAGEPFRAFKAGPLCLCLLTSQLQPQTGCPLSSVSLMGLCPLLGALFLLCPPFSPSFSRQTAGGHGSPPARPGPLTPQAPFP